MAEPTKPDAGALKLPDPSEIGRSMADIAERSQRIVGEWLKRQAESGPASPDPLNIGGAFMEMTTRLMANPARLMEAQLGFWNDYMSLWQSAARRLMGMETRPVIEGDPKDRASRTMPGRKTRFSTSSARATCCRRARCRTW